MEKTGERLNWIKDLVKSEERMEETGVVDMSIGFDNEKIMAHETLVFLQNLKDEMIESANAFNELKSSPLGRIKIYGIAKTQADFMLFRNGYKMIFAMKSPGVISIRFNFLGPNQYLPTTTPSVNQAASNLMEEHLIIAKRGPFKEMQWTFLDEKVEFAAMVRYHITLFVRESAK